MRLSGEENCDARLILPEVFAENKMLDFSVNETNEKVRGQNHESLLSKISTKVFTGDC